MQMKICRRKYPKRNELIILHELDVLLARVKELMDDFD